MGNCCPNALISIGFFILLLAGILTVGFNLIVKTAVPIALNFLPFNSTLQLWLEIPLALDLKAQFTFANASKDISNKTLALGTLGFKVEMATWTDDSEVFPIVWIEEEARVDLFQRYLLVLSDGPLNYAQYFSWAIGGVGILGAIGAGALRILKGRG